MKTAIDGGYLISEKFGDGKPILFIHGYPLSRRIWDPQLKELAKYGTIITLDLRGHGESFEFDGAYTMDMLADDCKRILDDQQITTPLIVCGLSMGGYITFALYRKYPELFEAMILTSTRPGSDSAEAKANRDASIKAALERGSIAIADAMIQKIISPTTLTTKPELVETIHEIMANTSTFGIVGALQGMRDRPDSTQILSKINCPVLIIHGEEDQLIPIKEAESMEQQIQNSRLIKIPQAGHLPNMEKPDDYNQALRDFIISTG